MNRKMRRQADKTLKNKLTLEQFNEIKGAVLEERVKEEVDRFVGNFVAVFKPALRENKISDIRADKIIEEVYKKSYSNYAQGEKGVPRPEEERYISPEKIVSITERFLKNHGIENSGSAAEELYQAFMQEGGEIR